MRARNLRRIGDVDDPRAGTFLFNHFTAQDADLALRTFDNITGWFTDRAGVNDSALLTPTGDSTYVFVNHVRLPTRRSGSCSASPRRTSAPTPQQTWKPTTSGTRR